MKQAAIPHDDPVPARTLADMVKEPYDTIDHWAAFGLLVFRRRGRTRLFPIAENRSRCRRIREWQNDGHSLTTINGLLKQSG